MHRIFCSSADISEDKITLNDKEEAHHLKDVLRLKIDDAVIACDEKGFSYDAVIEKLTAHDMVLKIKARRKGGSLKKIKITLTCALPKNARFDDIVDKLTQLGVDKIIPLQTERVILKLDKTKAVSRLLRWRKIALNAAQQSQRNTLPVIERIKSLPEVLSEAEGYDLKIIPTLSGKRKTLKEIFSNQKPANILILIGPEGDFTEEEVELAQKAGCIPVTLGESVLRVDTAAIAVVSFIKLYEDH